jgi:hypothetical protein
MAVQELSKHQAADAAKAAGGADLRSTMLTTLQQLYVPMPPGASDPIVTGELTFNSTFKGALAATHARIIEDIPQGKLVSYEAMTNPILYPNLADAFTDYLSAIDQKIDFWHAHTYKTSDDRQAAPKDMHEAMRRMARQIAEHIRTNGTTPVGYGRTQWTPGTGQPFRWL